MNAQFIEKCEICRDIVCMTTQPAFAILFQALFDVAGVEDGSDRVDGAGRPAVPKTASFECPHDGHFGDRDDCTKFYRCAHGVAQVWSLTRLYSVAFLTIKDQCESMHFYHTIKV